MPVPALADEKSAVNRFNDPLYSRAEASRFLGLTPSALRTLASGHVRHIDGREVAGEPLITTLANSSQRGPSIPFRRAGRRLCARCHPQRWRSA